MNWKLNSTLRLIPLLVILAFVLAACPAQQPAAPAEEAAPAEQAAPAQEEAAPAEQPAQAEEAAPATGRGAGGTLTILYWQAASLPGPYLSGGTKDIDAGALVLEPLAAFDENGEMVLRLAAEIPTVENGGVAEDLTSITWKLKEGLLWSDGTPVTAEDVVFTYEYCSTPETGCSQADQFTNIDSVEALDDTTVRINFSGPTPYPYLPFVGYTEPIIQKAQFKDCVGAAAQTCTEQNLNPIGTGPYKIREFRVNDVVIYDINENYREPDKPYFSEVIFKGGGDAAAAARAVLETGEADYAWNLQVEPQILQSMEAAGLGTVVAAYATNVERLMVNQTNPDPALGDMRSVGVHVVGDPNYCPEQFEGYCNTNNHPFLTDLNVVKALSMAIDRNTIAEQLYGFAGRPTCNVLPAPPAYASPNNDWCLTQDIDGANKLLDDAGIVDTDGDGIREKDGVPLKILYQTSTNSVRQKTQALIKQWWSEIGVETELRNIDAAVFFGGDPNSPDTYGKFYADIEMYTNGATGVDSQIYMSNWLCEAVSGPWNNFLGNNVPRW
ncbi:MAG: peptide ABC transporter substrate-binding protein, partial [Caldilineae bacterium]